MTTLAQFRTAVSSKLGLDNTTSGDQGAIDLWANEGVTDVLMRTRCRVRSATMTLTAGTKDYTLDTGIMLIIDCYVTATSIDYQLERISPDDLRAMRRNSSGNVSPAQYYAVEGSDLFLIYPTPAAADTVTIYYVPRPATLSLSSDSPSELPAEFHKAVEFYMLREGADYSDDASARVGLDYQQLYEQWLRRIKRLVALKGRHRLPQASVRRGRTALPPHDRSTYP